MKKLIVLICTIITAFSLFLYFYLRPHDYEEHYQINNYDVVEKYLKKEKVYYFLIDNKYDFIKEYNYSTTRHYITEITQANNCITIKLKDKTDYNICKNEDYNINIYKQNKEKLIKTYQDINIYNFKNLKFLIWDYKNILNLNNETKIQVFNKGAYNSDLFIKIKEFLVIPNLENEYEFNEFIIYDIENNKTSNWSIKYTISSDSYILGILDKNIYLVDMKNQKEYKINPFKEKIEIIGSNSKKGQIYNNGWEEISVSKLTNEKLKFSNNSFCNYYLENNIIYLNYLNSNIKTKVIEGDNIKIYETKDNSLFYLKDDTLYLFHPDFGNIKLMQRFEWNFNYKNKIFIY